MKYANEALIENLQKLSNMTGDYEVQVYGPLVRGQILLKNGRIRYAEAGAIKGEEALRVLIISASTKHMVRKLPVDNKNDIASMDLNPGEGIIAALMYNEEKINAKYDQEETQPIPALKSDDKHQTDLHMYTVVLELNNPIGECAEYSLNEGRNLIGRYEDCDVNVDSNLTSREHAMITVSDQKVMIKDLQTLNGTRLNMQQVVEAELHDGDVLEIGGIELKVAFRLKIRDEHQHGRISTGKIVDDIYTKETRRVHFENFVETPNRTLSVSEILNELFSERKNEVASIGIVKQARI